MLVWLLISYAAYKEFCGGINQKVIVMKNKFAVLRSKVGKGLTVAGTTVAAFATTAAHAIDDTAIEAAQTAAQTSVQLTATGMIQIVAVVVGVGLVVSLLKRL